MSVLPVLLVLFIAVPIAELAVIIQVGQTIGLWWTIGLLVADSILGSVLMRMQGRLAWRRFTEASRAGRPPAREVLDGALVLLGGALLLTPGFLTDILGLALLLPPTRAVVRRILARRLLAGMVAGLTGAGPHGAPPRGPSTGPSGTRGPSAGPFGTRGPSAGPFGSGAPAGGPFGSAGPSRGPFGGRRPAEPDDVEGTAVDLDPPSSLPR